MNIIEFIQGFAIQCLFSLGEYFHVLFGFSFDTLFFFLVLFLKHW